MLSPRAARAIKPQSILKVLHSLDASLPHPGREAERIEGSSSSLLSPMTPWLQRAFGTQRLQCSALLEGAQTVVLRARQGVSSAIHVLTVPTQPHAHTELS